MDLDFWLFKYMCVTPKELVTEMDLYLFICNGQCNMLMDDFVVWFERLVNLKL